MIDPPSIALPDVDSRARRLAWTLFAVCVVALSLANVSIVAGALNGYPPFRAIARAYWIDTVVAPIGMLLTAFVSILLWIRTDRSQKSLALLAIASALVACCLFTARVYATHIEPHRLQTRFVTIETDKVTQPIRILHISDTQCDVVDDYIVGAFERMVELKPDLVLFTGDLLQPLPPATTQSELPKIAALFETLRPPLGIFGVFGDTDHRISQSYVGRLGGLEMVWDGDGVLKSSGGELAMLCLPLGQSHNGGDRVAQWLRERSPDEFTIVMGHAPDYAIGVAEAGLDVDLCLAGHTHGGQVRLPFYGPIFTLSDVPREWARGFREIGRSRLNVSAGIGCEHAEGIVDLRINCPPEMTLIELVPEIDG